jgi:hypothetical protein
MAQERDRRFSRRTVLKAGVAGVAGSTLGLIGRVARLPERAAAAVPLSLPDIQFDLDEYIGPVVALDGTTFRFGPVFTVFLTARLTGTPTPDDQTILDGALATIEGSYAFSPSGVFTMVGYGLPYFARLPVGLRRAHIPRLLQDPSRFALEEAVSGPTDVSPEHPRVRKRRFNVPVRIERNDLLFSIRSDDLSRALDVATWLAGSGRLQGMDVASPPFQGLVRFHAPRVMFVQQGMPRRVADQAGLPFARRVNPESPMWMGFADQQTSGSGPPAITTFQGNASARFTDAQPGDYFDNGSIQHLSHVILDLEQFYLGKGETEKGEESYFERVQYMFRSTPPPSPGYRDQLTDGGGPAYLPNEFKGVRDALRSARGIGTPEREHRLGHLSALQRSSRAADGTPIHIRMDGPGFDPLDVPGGSNQPKLHFSIFVPTAHEFAKMRRHQASRDLARRYKVADDDQGLERFLTATRRQNFLVPPRRNRAFPLVELAS